MKKQKSSKKTLITIISVSLAIIIGVSVFLIFNKKNEETDVTTENQTNEVSDNYTGMYIPVTIGNSNIVWTSDSVTIGKRTWKFNDKGQIIEFKDSDPAGPSDPSYTCIYSDDKLIQKDSSTTSSFYEYDINGNLIKYSMKYRSENDIKYSVNIEYDSEGRICKTTSHDGFINSVKYQDDNSVIITLTENAGDPDILTLYYNDNNQLIKLDAAVEGLSNVEYDNNGNPETITTADYNTQTKITWGGNGTKEQALFIKIIYMYLLSIPLHSQTSHLLIL